MSVCFSNAQVTVLNDCVWEEKKYAFGVKVTTEYCRKYIVILVGYLCTI